MNKENAALKLAASNFNELQEAKDRIRAARHYDILDYYFTRTIFFHAGMR